MTSELKVLDQNFWSKQNLPHFKKPNGYETFTSMWVSIFPRGEEVTPDQFYRVCERIIVDMEINKVAFCPESRNVEEVDYSFLSEQIMTKLFKPGALTDVVLITDEKGIYKGIATITDYTLTVRTTNEKIKYWYISFVCTATGTKGYGKQLIQDIKTMADKTPNLRYVFLETIEDARGFYNYMGFVHVNLRKDEREATCIKGIPKPKIYDKNYEYEEDDLLVYCPKQPVTATTPEEQAPSQPVTATTSSSEATEFKVGEIVIYTGRSVMGTAIRTGAKVKVVELADENGDIMIEDEDGNTRYVFVEDLKKQTNGGKRKTYRRRKARKTTVKQIRK